MLIVTYNNCSNKDLLLLCANSRTEVDLQSLSIHTETHSKSLSRTIDFYIQRGLDGILKVCILPFNNGQNIVCSRLQTEVRKMVLLIPVLIHFSTIVAKVLLQGTQAKRPKGRPTLSLPSWSSIPNYSHQGPNLEQILLGKFVIFITKTLPSNHSHYINTHVGH